jgi:hypothetical protein
VVSDCGFAVMRSILKTECPPRRPRMCPRNVPNREFVFQIGLVGAVLVAMGGGVKAGRRPTEWSFEAAVAKVSPPTMVSGPAEPGPGCSPPLLELPTTTRLVRAGTGTFLKPELLAAGTNGRAPSDDRPSVRRCASGRP